MCRSGYCTRIYVGTQIFAVEFHFTNQPDQRYLSLEFNVVLLIYLSMQCNMFCKLESQHDYCNDDNDVLYKVRNYFKIPRIKSLKMCSQDLRFTV